MEEIQIGSVLHSGDRVQYALGLQSPDFSIEECFFRSISSVDGHGSCRSYYSQQAQHHHDKEQFVLEQLIDFVFHVYHLGNSLTLPRFWKTIWVSSSLQGRSWRGG